MTMQQAIRQARDDLAWHVTRTGTERATVRFTDSAGRHRSVETDLTEPDKAAQLRDWWLANHEALDAGIDSVDMVSTPNPVRF